VKTKKKLTKKEEAKQIVLRAFKSLTKKQRENLRWHGRRKTPVACGKSALRYVNRKGYG